MFTFDNPNTPIIADGTQVEHAGLIFTVTCSQYHYNVYLSDPQDIWTGGVVGMIPQAGRRGCFDWTAGVKEVEETIRREADNHHKARTNA